MEVNVRKAQVHDIPEIMKMKDILNEVGSTIESMKRNSYVDAERIVYRNKYW